MTVTLNSMIETTAINECSICYKKIDTEIKKYFNCDISKHNICDQCFINHKKEKDLVLGLDKCECPVCRAPLDIYYKNPCMLSHDEKLKVDYKEIKKEQIFIHQNFVLRDNIAKVTTSCNTELYTRGGKFATVGGMFVGVNGFLYEYNDEKKCYSLAVKQNKYQFWDNSRVMIIRLL
jgi:hypothetical protein